MKKGLIIFLFMSCYSVTTAQHKPDTLRDIIRSFYFPEKDIILITRSDGYAYASPDNPTFSVHKPIRGWNYLMAVSDFHMFGDRLLLIDRHEHSIYEVSGDSLVLRERVSHPKISINNQIFRHGKNFYLYGGYGLWSNRRSLLRVNETGRWEPVVFDRKPVDTEESAFPPGIHSGMVAVTGEKAILFKGLLVDPNDPLINPPNHEVWQLDLRINRWTKLGMINQKVFRTEMENDKIITGDKRIFLFPDSRSVVELDNNGKKIHLYRYTLASSEILRNDHFRFRGFIRKGKVHYHFIALDADESRDGKEAVVFRTVQLSEFLGNRIGEDVLYIQSSTFSFYWVLLPVALAGAYAGFRMIRRWCKPSLLKLSAEGLIYRSVLHELEPNLTVVLKRLLEADDMVSSNELTTIIRNPNLQYSHNNRMKNEIIRQLNLRFKSILNIRQDLITSTVSEQDKRYRWYRIDKMYFKA